MDLSRGLSSSFDGQKVSCKVYSTLKLLRLASLGAILVNHLNTKALQLSSNASENIDLLESLTATTAHATAHGTDPNTLK